MRRILLATLLGLLAGVLCATVLFRFGAIKFTAATLGWIFLNRAVMGFCIGASGLRLHWAWNGILMGFVVGSIFSYYLFMTMGGNSQLLFVPVGNAVFGFLIEFFTTVVFKEPAHPIVKVGAATA